MRVFLIYNQMSGRKKYREKDKVLKQLLKNTEHEIIWHYTTPQGSFHGNNPDDFDRIIVCGGDGTLNEAINWIISNKSTTPLALIPNGTGNVVAQSIGIPVNTKQAFDLSFKDSIQKIDVGVVNNREYFLLSASIGIDAQVIKNTSKKLKRLIGYPAYIISFFQSLLNVRPNKYFIKYDSKETTIKAQAIFITNFFKFGKFINNPDAKINDGYLNLGIDHSINTKNAFFAFLKMVLGTYSKDSHYEHHKVKHVYIQSRKTKVAMQIDGDVVRLPYMDIKVVPKALNLIAPPLN